MTLILIEEMNLKEVPHSANLNLFTVCEVVVVRGACVSLFVFINGGGVFVGFESVICVLNLRLLVV